MFKNAFINYLLRHLPNEQWNDLSTICSWFSLPTIGSPIQFDYKEFQLKEIAPNGFSPSLLKKFLRFCYPTNLPDREQQIEYDQMLYWNHATTFLVTNNRKTIVGCVQVIQRTNDNKLPVEYATSINPTGSRSTFNLLTYTPSNNITEIYRCRRSFDLSTIDAINVLLVLFKAIWIYTIRTETAYTCISYDCTKPELRNLYVRKLAFHDPGITLVFGDTPQRWCLLFKDWARHKKEYATLGKTQFFIQTWCKMSYKKHVHLPKQHLRKPVESRIDTADTILATRNVIIPNIRKNHIRTMRQKSTKSDHNGK